MSKHTPGPWHIDGDPDDGRIVTEFVDDRIEVWTGGERTAPDVRLIAAAPDLLAACRILMGVAEWAERNRKRSIMDVCDWSIVRAAISKAEGNS